LSRLSPPWHRLRPAAMVNLLGLLGRWDHADREKIILKLTSEHFGEHLKTQAEWRQIHLQRPVSRLSALAQLSAAATYNPPRRALPSVPTLVLGGGKDRIVSPKCSKRLAHWLNASLAVNPLAGHDL